MYHIAITLIIFTALIFTLLSRGNMIQNSVEHASTSVTNYQANLDNSLPALNSINTDSKD